MEFFRPASVPARGRRAPALAAAFVLVLGLALGFTHLGVAASPAISPPLKVAQTDVCAGLTNGTLPASTNWPIGGSPYVVNCMMTIPAGVTLTIQPGVEVQFGGSGDGLVVLGTLSAVGDLVAGPIVFTGVSKTQASWIGLVFGQPAGPAITGSVLSDVTVEYGGYPGSGNIQLYQAQVSIDHATIRYGGGPGIYASDANSWANVSDSTFDHNGGYAIEHHDGTARPVLARLAATNNGYNQTQNTYDPSRDAVSFAGATLHGAYTWAATGVPYVFGETVVAAGSQLTVQPGVEARFTGAIGLYIDGTISANGTAGHPILLTGNQKQPAYWVGVTVSGTSTSFNSGSTFTYVTIEYGGYPNATGNLNLNYASATVANCTLQNGSKYGLATSNGSWVDISNSLITGNGVDANGVSTSSILGAIYIGDASANQKMTGLMIQNNGVSNDKNFVVVGGGQIHSAVRWTIPAPGVPYLVSSGIDIWSGGALTIDPGVEVQFTGYSIAANEDGQLIADGTAAQPIKFTGYTKTPGSWNGLVFSGTSSKPNTGSRLRYVTVEYGGSSGGDIYLEWAWPEISHATITHSSGYGLYGRVEAGPKVAYTTISDNADYAIYLHEVDYKPEFDHLTATNNGPANNRNAIDYGGGTLSGDNFWPNAGLPYILDSDMSVAAGAQLTIAPGVQISFAQGREFLVNGRLLALGTAAQPIRLTGLSPVRGWWRGLHFFNVFGPPSTGSRLEYLTVEYGGGGYANIHIESAQVAISHSLIHGSVSDGLYVQSGGDLVSIDTSQIVDNGNPATNYGVYNNDPQHTVVSAPNNWWGAASGPTFGGACTTGGTGSRVSGGVDFMPILSTAGGDPGTLAPGLAGTLTLEPDRWYLPADGVMQAVILATLRDGAGLPLPGYTVLATTSLGHIVEGGITDASGQARILLSSPTAGDALVTATVDQGNQPCMLVHSAGTRITFTPLDSGSALTPGAGAPYADAHIAFGPEPLMRGVPANVTVTLENPSDQAIVVNANLGIAQSGIGLTFGPIQQWQNVPIAAHGTVALTATYTPLVVGHFCFRVNYSWQPAGINAASQTASATRPLLVTAATTGTTGSNTNSNPAPLNHQRLKEEFGVQGKKVKLREFGTPPPSTPPPDTDPPKADINRRINDSVQVTRDIGNSMRGDPPSQDYMTIVRPVMPVMPVYQAGYENLTIDQAAAVNTLLAALADGIGYGRAVLASDDRYAGAVEAGNLTWAAQQTAAILAYRKQMGQAYVRVADALQNWVNVYPGDQTPTVASVIAIQQRLSTTGFSADEIARFTALGSTTEDIERLRQAIIAGDPVAAAVSVRIEYAEMIADYRSIGDMLVNPPPVFSQSTGPIAPARTAAGTQANLAAVYEVTQTILVGNPPTNAPATIDLRTRPLGLPSNWGVAVTPSQVTLAPGAQQPVTVTITPASVVPQGIAPRVAVEGYLLSDGSLVGGVEFTVVVPTYAPLYHWLYLPLVKR